MYFGCLSRYLSAHQSLILRQDESPSESLLLALWKRWTLRESARIGHYQVSSYTTMVAKSPLWWCLHFIRSRNSSTQNFCITWFRSPLRCATIKNGRLEIRAAIWLQGKVCECGLELRPRLNVAVICDEQRQHGRICGLFSASEKTYIVLGGALNSTHSLWQEVKFTTIPLAPCNYAW